MEATTTHSSSSTRVIILPGAQIGVVSQRALHHARGPYVVVDGQTRGAPAMGANSQSTAYARSYSSTAGLGTADSVDLNATARWLASNADLQPRPDLGSDVTVWNPHWGSAPGWLLHAASAPYVDVDYEYFASRERKKTTQAMVFNGNSWAQSLIGTGHNEFAIIMVAVLHHPRTNAWQDIVASPSAVTDPSRALDCVLRYHNGTLQAYINGKLSEASLHPPIHKQRLRPTIILWSEGARGGTLGVVTAHGRHFHDYAHKVKSNFDLRLFLANNGGAPTVDNAADIDVLDLAYYDHRLTTATGRKYLQRLDHAYGVSGR